VQSLWAAILKCVASLSCDRTMLGCALSVFGWGLLWAQPVLGFFLIPPAVAALAFFTGLAIGGWAERGKARARRSLETIGARNSAKNVSRPIPRVRAASP
jgi:hypothetical protein